MLTGIKKESYGIVLNFAQPLKSLTVVAQTSRSQPDEQRRQPGLEREEPQGLGWCLAPPITTKGPVSLPGPVLVLVPVLLLALPVPGAPRASWRHRTLPS